MGESVPSPSQNETISEEESSFLGSESFVSVPEGLGTDSPNQSPNPPTPSGQKNNDIFQTPIAIKIDDKNKEEIEYLYGQNSLKKDEQL